MATIIDGTGLADYQMRDSDGPAALMPFNGNFRLLLKAGKHGKSEAGNTTASFTFVVQDPEDWAKGSVLYWNGSLSGKVESGPQAGRLRLATLVDIAISAGRQDIADMIVGRQFDLDQVIPMLVGDGRSTFVYARVVQQEDDRDSKLRSVPSYFIRHTKYEESKASGSNFRVLPQTKARKTPGAASTNTNGAITPPQATDSLAAEV